MTNAQIAKAYFWQLGTRLYVAGHGLCHGVAQFRAIAEFAPNWGLEEYVTAHTESPYHRQLQQRLDCWILQWEGCPLQEQ